MGKVKVRGKTDSRNITARRLVSGLSKEILCQRFSVVSGSIGHDNLLDHRSPKLSGVTSVNVAVTVHRSGQCRIPHV